MRGIASLGLWQTRARFLLCEALCGAPTHLGADGLAHALACLRRLRRSRLELRGTRLRRDRAILGGARRVERSLELLLGRRLLVSTVAGSESYGCRLG